MKIEEQSITSSPLINISTGPKHDTNSSQQHMRPPLSVINKAKLNFVGLKVESPERGCLSGSITGFHDFAAAVIAVLWQLCQVEEDHRHEGTRDARVA